MPFGSRVILDRKDIIVPVSSIVRPRRAAICRRSERLDAGVGERFTGFSPARTDYWMRRWPCLFPVSRKMSSGRTRWLYVAVWPAATRSASNSDHMALESRAIIAAIRKMVQSGALRRRRASSTREISEPSHSPSRLIPESPFRHTMDGARTCPLPRPSAPRRQP